MSIQLKINQIRSFQSKLLGWYELNKRELPWRETKNPYYIWLSEVILQQTRIAQGTSYYLSFVKNFPKVDDLAKAPEDKVMKLWQGLGYYSRARNLHKTAKFVVDNYKSKFPDSYNELLKLPGVGPYTAAAIASIAFNEQVAAVDGNVYRVLSRIFGIEDAIDSTIGKKKFQELAQILVSADKPSDFNQALMEFGATHCTPKQPNCKECAFTQTCFAYKNDLQNSLPNKEKKTKVRNRYFNFIVINKDEYTYIEKRTVKDIWQNLYQFPLIESEKDLSIDEFLELKALKNILTDNKYVVTDSTKLSKHILSHQNLFSQFITLKIEKNLEKTSNLIKIRQKELKNYAFPRLIDKYLQNLKTKK